MPWSLSPPPAVCAVVAVVQVVYEDSQMVTLAAPYIAGFLAFRETPFLLDCLKRLEKSRPDLLPQVPPSLQDVRYVRARSGGHVGGGRFGSR